MKIKYKVYPDAHGPAGSFLYAVLLDIQVALPQLNAPRTRRFEAIVDSGATRTLLHADFARHLGLDISTVKLKQHKGSAEVNEFIFTT